MAKTESTMLPLGTTAPPFELTDVVSQTSVKLSDFHDKAAVVIMFICNHCPFVKHVRQGIADLARDYQPKNVGFVGISSNDITTHPDDSPEKMVIEAREANYSFPYLFDADQAVAKAYKAACTPDFFVFDRDQKLVYRGQLDSSRPGNGVPVTGSDLRAALDALLAGNQPSPEQRPSIGCNIKWTPGKEPDYFMHG